MFLNHVTDTVPSSLFQNKWKKNDTKSASEKLILHLRKLSSFYFFPFCIVYRSCCDSVIPHKRAKKDEPHKKLSIDTKLRKKNEQKLNSFFSLCFFFCFMKFEAIQFIYILFLCLSICFAFVLYAHCVCALDLNGYCCFRLRICIAIYSILRTMYIDTLIVARVRFFPGSKWKEDKI